MLGSLTFLLVGPWLGWVLWQKCGVGFFDKKNKTFTTCIDDRIGWRSYLKTCKQESQSHIFFDCSFNRKIWRSIMLMLGWPSDRLEWNCIIKCCKINYRVKAWRVVSEFLPWCCCVSLVDREMLCYMVKLLGL
jgi:hypothetical protein